MIFPWNLDALHLEYMFTRSRFLEIGAGCSSQIKQEGIEKCLVLLEVKTLYARSAFSIDCMTGSLCFDIINDSAAASYAFPGIELAKSISMHSDEEN